MKLGLFAMPLHDPKRPHYETYEEDLNIIKRGDELGFVESWIGQHFTLPWENMPAPDLFMAKALALTEQMTLATGVTLLHYHNPVEIALRMAMFDHLAKGRFYFGIGSGASAEETKVFGIDVDSGSPRDRMNESIELILKLWTEDGPFDFKGKYFNSEMYSKMNDRQMWHHMKPYQDPHPPIAVAGTSPKSETLQVAGKKGWMPLSSAFVHSSFLPMQWEMVEQGAKEVGKVANRDTWRISREIYVANTTELAKDDILNGPFAEGFLNYWLYLIGNGPRGKKAFKVDQSIPDSELTPEYMLENFWIVGSPDEVTQKIKDLQDLTGGFGTLLTQTHDWGKNINKAYNSMELLSKEVLPAINS